MEGELIIREILFFKTKFNDNRVLNQISIILIFICMILIGSDRIGFQLGTMNIRFVQILMLLEVGILILLGSYKVVLSVSAVLVLITHILSTIFSYNVVSSIAYDIWIVYNLLFVLYLFYSITKKLGKERIINLLLYSFLIQSIYIYIQFSLGVFGIDDPIFPMQYYMGIYRPSIWFYEPSYLATYFTIYLSLSVYLLFNNYCKKYLIHTLNGILSLILITSTVGYLAIGLILFVVFLMNIKKLIKINRKLLITFCAIMISLLAILPFLNIKFIDVFLGRIFKDGIILSSGERIVNWKVAFNVFTNHPFIGIGPNAYPEYSMTGKPPTNVILELLANTGLIGFLAFSFFIGIILYKCYKSQNSDNVFNKAIVFSVIIFLITLQANQNYMRLYLWMMLGICMAFISDNEKDKQLLEIS